MSKWLVNEGGGWRLHSVVRQSSGFNRPVEELALIVSFHDSIQTFQANAKVAVTISEWYPTSSFHISDSSLFADCPITEALRPKVLTLSFHNDDDNIINSLAPELFF